MFFEFRKLRIYENSYGVWAGEVMRWLVKTNLDIDDTRGETAETGRNHRKDESTEKK